MEIQAELSRIVINETVDQQIIVIKEMFGERSFPVVIGINEILAIDRRLKGIQLPRPMTHDLLESVIEKMGGKIEKVVVSNLDNHTFYATLHVSIDKKTVQIDSRPSDAIALTSGLDVPLYVEDRVFDQLGI